MTAGPQARTPAASWTDERLVRECLRGSEDAWSALIDRYKNLIYSVPIKHGLSAEDAADVFQAVCLDLLTELPRLRHPRAVGGWLIRVAAHKCIRWQRGERRILAYEAGGARAEAQDDRLPGAMLDEIEREQALRDAIAELPPRCRELVHALFFVAPPRTYQQIAASLGLATGSVGFIRGRCLEKLRRRLEELGFA